jgi:hypothetical protein
LADEQVRAIYEEAAKHKNVPVFALTIADFFNAPTVDDVDLSAYNGNVGDTLKIKASDEFGVASVHVALTNLQNGAAIESGNAVETAPGSGLWVYTATVAVNSGGTTVKIDVVATDRPGGTAVAEKSKSL